MTLRTFFYQPITKDYDEYKANKDKHKALNIFMKVIEIILIFGCVIGGLFFLLMVAFPKGLWTGFLRLLWH